MDLQAITTAIQDLPPYVLPTVAAFVGGGAAVGITTQIIRRKWHLDAKGAKKTIAAILTAFSFVGSVASFIITTPGTNAIITIGGNTFTLLGVAIFVQNLLLSPLYRNIYKNLSDVVKDAKTHRQSVEVQPVVPPESSDSKTFEV
jgi:hypothetical protein